MPVVGRARPRMSLVESERVTVDGEAFDVRTGEVPGQYHYDWVSCPHQDDGFSSAASHGRSLTTEQHVHAIRDFLAAVDPTTGHLEDEDED